MRAKDLLRVLLVLLCTGAGAMVRAQRTKPALTWDTTYIRDLSDRPTIRVYGSHKFNSFAVQAVPDMKDLRYRPNEHFNLGVGISYKRLTLNIGLPAPVVNDDNEELGRTRFIDAQANLYTVRQVSNLFLQRYEGYHITSHTKQELGWEQHTLYPYRGDVRQFNFGVSSLRIQNHERFSYRAAFNQDAWQLRSAGTWLYGGYITCYVVKADSSIVPSALSDAFRTTSSIREGTFADAGPMVGYAYAHVHHKHWFAVVSGAAGIGLSIQRLRVPAAEGERVISAAGPGWHLQGRAAIGYNGAKRYVGAFYNQELVGYALNGQDLFVWDVGNFRIMVAQRINRRPRTVDKDVRWLRSKDPTK